MFRSYLKTVLFILLLSAGTIHAYDYLTVQDPKNWRSARGTIEEATISIRPMGLYMEYGLYLTFSARTNDYYKFGANDTLEVQYYFDLPKEAIVHDLWLWVGNDIIRANILDKWTASSIYENIVQRRRDPAILFKRGQGNYELRVFPMAGNQTRKVKLTYLVPTQWLANSVTSALPMNMLRISSFTPKLHLLYWPEKNWSNPRFLEFSSVKFTSVSDPQFKDYMKADIPAEAIAATLNFALDSPLRNGVYLSRFENKDEGVYQLAYLPSQALQIQPVRKTAILLDYDGVKSNIPVNQVIETIKANLGGSFNPKDSFNIIYSQLTVKKISDKWIAADSASIEKYFSELTKNPVSNYSNLPTLLSEGINFIKAHGNNGTILLVTDSDQAGDYRVANKLIDDLLKTMNPLLPINVVDFNNQSYSYYYFGGRSYYGNEYFSDNISRLTNGIYKNIRSGSTSLQDMVSSAFQSLSGFISSFDLLTTLENGYCFGRYNLSPVDQSIYLNRPILQIGKYKGTFPFNLQASGVFKSQVFSNKASLTDVATSQNDSLLEEAWAGNYIRSLEGMQMNNNLVNQIVETSIKNRVISLYTSFLSLEPNDTIKACKDCLDETLFTNVGAVEATDKDTLQLQAFPNPFNSQTVIKIRLPLNFNETQAQFKIYNVLGQVVRTFEVGSLGNSRSLRLEWNGRNDNGENVTSGIYFFIVTSQTSRHSVKLLMLK